MATRWQVDMQERVEKVEATVGEFRERFDAIDRRFDEFEERLSKKLDMRLEYLEELVNKTAESFGGVLSRLDRGLTELTDEVRQQSKQTALILQNHENRISAIERDRPM
jgi:archaellum component FlaC